MTRRAWRIAVLFIAASVLALLVVALVAAEENRRVVGTAHDVATGDTPVCIYCHLRGDPTAPFLWDQGPNPSREFSGLKPLCFSCHDGTAAPLVTYVFNPLSPVHPGEPGIRGQDCDRCHDPHNSGYGRFIKVPGAASFCRDCHFKAGPTDHPVEIDAIERGVTPFDREWDAKNGDTQGTRLWNEAGTGPGNLVKCLTCHSPHGGQPFSSMLTFSYPSGTAESPPLCGSCHAIRSRP